MRGVSIEVPCCAPIGSGYATFDGLAVPIKTALAQVKFGATVAARECFGLLRVF